MESAQTCSSRCCRVCGVAVGSYEPAVFIVGDQTIFSSRAAKPGLSARPGCSLEHLECHADFGRGGGRHLRLV